MNTLAEIEAAAKSLPLQQQEELFAFLAARLGRNGGPTSEQIVAVPRRAGLHAGLWNVSPDFDAPLPDAFWLGSDQ